MSEQPIGFPERDVSEESSVELQEGGEEFIGEFGERELGDPGFAGEFDEREHEGRHNVSRETTEEGPID